MIKNKLLYITAAGLVSSMFPTNGNTQTFYQCLPCPTGTSSKNGKCETCPAGTYSASTGSSSCLSCDKGTFSASNRAQCYNINNIDHWNTTPIAQATKGNCTTYTIPKNGLYAVHLKGGHGSYGYHNKYSGQKSPNSGGEVTYYFTTTKGTSIELCAGGSGEFKTNPTGGGGGAGSWIKIGNAYIVAGGGGGGGDGGAGGAIGAGGSGNDFKSSKHYACAGGSVGPYKSPAPPCCHKDGATGQAINGNNGGRGGNNGANSEGGSATGVTLFAGYVRTKVGGNTGQIGTATHNSNLTIDFKNKNASYCDTFKFNNFSTTYCYPYGQAQLYSWKYN